MAATATPYGLIPVKRADGMPYAGATTEYLIDPAGEASNIFHGQVVHIGTDGYIALSTATGADGTTNAFPVGTTLYGSIGVFMGCEYVNAQGQLIHAQYYPSAYAAPTGSSIKAYVVDDPNVLFKAQLDGAAAQADIGDNTFFATAQSTSTGSTATGNSTSALDATTVTTSAAFRIVSAYSPISDAFPDVLVKFNPGYHSLTYEVAAS
ncbi:MAG: hypothetical protein ACYSX1_10250 [Planctomycetota bacterium]|jgi:hypothetical protein